MRLSPGVWLGPYEILEAIGAGGMGEVYRAGDAKLGRDVALKVLPDAFARDAERMARFDREAKVLASLNHPNIASIYGLDDSCSTHALVMELVEGLTLAARIKAGAIPIDEAVRIAKQICDGLEYAHERGIVHRDLKPANVKVTKDEAVKILDFGLAKALEGDGSSIDLSSSPTLSRMATQAGVLLGTAAYMAPEQAKGKPVDRRADIWAFGVLLAEMLTGQPIYSGETTPDILARVIEREPDLSQLPVSTPAPVLELIRRCLAKNPRQRLRDIGDARLVLEEYLANPCTAPSRAGGAGERPSPSRTRLLVWFFGGVLFGALAAGVALWKLRPAPPSQSMLRFSAVTNFTGIDAQPSFSPDGRSLAFLSNRGGQFDIWVGLITGGSPVRITNDPDLKGRPHWSPDGSKILYSRLNGSGLWDTWMVASLGGTPRKFLTNATDAVWSPDSNAIAYADGFTHTIWMCDAMGSHARALTQAESRAWHLQPAFSRDGRKIAFVRRGSGPYGEIAWAEVPSGKVESLTDDKASSSSPVWSADNQFVYFASSRGGTTNLWKVSAKGGAPVQVTAGRGDDTELDVSPDGKKIVFASQRSAINLEEATVDSTTESEQRWLTTDASRNTYAPAYSPDGHRIAYFTTRKGAENEPIWVMDADGSNPVKLVEDSNLNIFPRWTPDGQSLVFVSRNRGIGPPRNLRRLSLSDTLPEELPVEPAEATWGDVGPDGRLVFRSKSGPVQVFDPRNSKTQTLDDIKGILLRWSPDSRHIASLIPAHKLEESDAGVWVYDSDGGAARQVFRGWVAHYAWAGANELFVLEGKPDLSAILWRVRLDGSPPIRTQTALRLRFSPQDTGTTVGSSFARLEVHPDHRHIIFEAFRFQESDISMIENIR